MMLIFLYNGVHINKEPQLGRSTGPKSHSPLTVASAEPSKHQGSQLGLCYETAHP